MTSQTEQTGRSCTDMMPVTHPDSGGVEGQRGSGKRYSMHLQGSRFAALTSLYSVLHWAALKAVGSVFCFRPNVKAISFPETALISHGPFQLPDVQFSASSGHPLLCIRLFFFNCCIAKPQLNYIPIGLAPVKASPGLATGWAAHPILHRARASLTSQVSALQPCQQTPSGFLCPLRTDESLQLEQWAIRESQSETCRTIMKR